MLVESLWTFNSALTKYARKKLEYLGISNFK